MSGNWAIARALRAINPARVMTIEMTSDRRGRSMNVEDSTDYRPLLARPRPSRLRPANSRAWIAIFQRLTKAGHAGVRQRLGVTSRELLDQRPDGSAVLGFGHAGAHAVVQRRVRRGKAAEVGFEVAAAETGPATGILRRAPLHEFAEGRRRRRHGEQDRESRRERKVLVPHPNLQGRLRRPPLPADVDADFPQPTIGIVQDLGADGVALTLQVLDIGVVHSAR